MSAADRFELVRDDAARLAPGASPAALARMVRYRRTGSAPGMPRWYVEDWRARMTARRYAEAAYTPRRYVTRMDNEGHRAWIFQQFNAARAAFGGQVTPRVYVRAWDRLNHYKTAA